MPVLDELTGTSVEQLAATHPAEIVNQIQAAARRISLSPYAAVTVALVALLTVPYGLLGLVLALPGIWWLRQRDIARRSVVVFYRVDDEPAQRFTRLFAAHSLACQTQRVWAVEAQGFLHAPYQRKVNAGASSLIRRGPATPSMTGPPVLVTNIAVPSLTSGNRSVHFLPDRILLRQGRAYAEIGYASLQVRMAPQRFIEDGSVPTDAQIVDTTWQYANARGGPDRRFKNNRQLPVMQYGRLSISNPSGLLMVWDFSNVQAVARLSEALQAMTR
ncbi:hypothetical protein [Plantactinospora mayteni]|nr:hypothetical protein [Plantactinospora mayteni]